MHFIFLFMNYGTSFGLRTAKLMDEEALRAVVILASQKTLPVSIAVINSLPDSVGDPGLMTIACIIAHLSQIVIDGFLISYLWPDQSSAEDPEPKAKKGSEGDDGEAANAAAEICGVENGVAMSPLDALDIDDDDVHGDGDDVDSNGQTLLPRDGAVYTVDVESGTQQQRAESASDEVVDGGATSPLLAAPATAKKLSALSTGSGWSAHVDYEEGAARVSMVPVPPTQGKATHRRTSIV